MLIKLPFGIKDGKLIHISEISMEQSGLKCKCLCPECGKELVARKGNIRVHHFAHNSDNCQSPLETSLHYFAKEILEKHKKIRIPAVILEYKDYHYSNENDNFYYTTSIKYETLYDERMIEFDKVSCEKKINNIRPDIILYKDNTPLFIEIAVSHFIDEKKLAKIKKLGISTIEIFLDNEEIDFYNFNREEVEEIIIESTNNKFWVYNRLLEEKKIEKTKEVELSRKFQENKHRQDLKIKKQRYLERVERIKKFDDEQYKYEKIMMYDSKIQKNKDWIKVSKELEISLEALPEFLNIVVEGEFSMDCDRRLWQSLLFSKFIRNNKGKLIHVKNVINWLKKDSNIPLNKDLLFTGNLSEIKAFDLTDAVYNYLAALVSYGMLSCISSNHIYYTEFIVKYGEINGLIGLNKFQIKNKIDTIIENEVKESKNQNFRIDGYPNDINAHNLNQSINNADTLIITKDNLNKSILTDNIPEIKYNIKKHPLLHREGVCTVCGTSTRDWVSFWGKDNTCLCRECDNKEKINKLK